MGVISWTATVGVTGQGTGAVGVISWTAGQALWVLLAGQRDRHCGCY